MATKCKTCNGVYDTPTASAVAYFHACPGARRLRVQELDGSYSTVAPGTEGVRPVVGERFVDRPGVRNENVTIDPATGKAATIADGTGVVTVPDTFKA